MVNLHKAISKILRKLKPLQAYRRMLDIISWRIFENLHKGNSDRVIREVAFRAEKS